MSAGIATIQPLAEQSWESLVEVADQQLYIAKHNGRNQVVGIDIEPAQ